MSRRKEFIIFLLSIFLLYPCLDLLTNSSANFSPIMKNNSPFTKGNYSSPEQIVSTYIQLAKEKNFLEFSQLLVKTPPSYWEMLEKKAESNQEISNENNEIKRQQNESLSSNEERHQSPDFTVIDKLSYDFLTNENPKTIESDGFYIKGLAEIEQTGDISIVRVILGSEKRPLLLYKQDYYLFNERNTGWKIFKVKS